MNETSFTNQNLPKAYEVIASDTNKLGFNMPSDELTCSLLKTLASSKPKGEFLELGTGSGLATAWILDGMDEKSKLVSFDYDPDLLAIAKKHLGTDPRLELVESDGADWVLENKDRRFDYIFADTWHGKYLLLDEVLEMLKVGGLYIVDDMLPQENWPEGHAEKASNFVDYLKSREDLTLTEMDWATGVIIAVKNKV